MNIIRYCEKECSMKNRKGLGEGGGGIYQWTFFIGHRPWVGVYWEGVSLPIENIFV